MAAAVLLAACGGGGGSSASAPALSAYVARVEPIRLRVNRLLDGADPILAAYRSHRLTPQLAQLRMGALERRFARDTVRIAALASVPAAMGAAQRAYAHTYVLEDAYLSALVAALPSRQFDDLPATQSQQRATIIGWRTRLQMLADRVDLRLPGDIQRAGRGEIAPSPGGS